MTNEKACTNIRKIIASQFKKAFNENLDAFLAQRNQELWLIGIDEEQKSLVDICGNIDPADMTYINSIPFTSAIAGYRADAHTVLELTKANVDAFLINTKYYNARPEIIEPIVVHELAHMLDQINQMPVPQYNDEKNADAIMKSLHPNQLDHHLGHNKQWAIHLAIGARTIITKNLTSYKTIRAYLEAAIPHFNRIDKIKAEKGWP